MQNTKTFFTTCVLLLIFQSSTRAQTWQDTSRKIAGIMQRYKPDAPGCQLAISRNGGVIYSKAWGMANLEYPAPLTANSLIEIGSVSKQFVAAAIMALQDQGKLSVNDDVRTYLPELKNLKTKVTINHLLQHTSGLREWGSIAMLEGWPRYSKRYSNTDALAILARQQNLDHKPGDEFIYCNSNYNMLALIVERASGQDLQTFCEKYVFRPAGLQHTRWKMSVDSIIPGRAYAYARSGDGYKYSMSTDNAMGGGGLLSTAEDLLRWNAYRETQLKSPGRVTLNNGTPVPYANGVYLSDYKGWQLKGHLGYSAGYRARLEYYPEKDLCFAWISNTNEFDTDTADAVLNVIDLFITDKENNKPRPLAPAHAPAQSELRQYTGWYRNKRTGEAIKFSIVDSSLFSLAAPDLTPTAKGKFRSGDMEIVFNPARKTAMAISYGDTVNMFATANADAKLNESYCGTYFSDEVNAGCSVFFRSDKLVMASGRKDTFALTPTDLNGFSFAWGNVYFEKKGAEWQMYMSVPGARKILYRRRKS